MTRKNYDCPVCGQYMEFIVTSHRNKPFVDGNCYARMCFCCFHVPKDIIEVPQEDGEVDEKEVYSYEHLSTPDELVLAGAADNLEQAKRCVKGVEAKIKEAGLRVLKKLRLSKPKAEYEQNLDYEKSVLEKSKSKTKKRKK